MPNLHSVSRKRRQKYKYGNEGLVAEYPGPYLKYHRLHRSGQASEFGTTPVYFLGGISVYPGTV